MNSMKLRDIHISKKNLRLERPYTIATKTVDHVENGIIEILGDNGLKGIGTFNPSYEVVGEELDQGLMALGGNNIDWLIGQELTDIESTCREVQKRFASSPSARIGLEIALYDLYTQSLGISLVKYLGQQIFTMPTSITIGIKNVRDTIEEAREYTDRKFRILKVKLGISLEEDLERLVKLREVFGYGIGIIIDANQGYNLAQLQQLCDEIAKLDIGLIEQPLKKGNEEQLRALPENIRRQLAADESLLSPADATALSSDPACFGYFNIKLMKCGGISQALEIAAIALKKNIGLMWGCNDESIVSITAALHTAFAQAHTKFIDLDGSLDLAIDVVKKGFVLEDGMMSLPDKPGLGLTYLD